MPVLVALVASLAAAHVVESACAALAPSVLASVPAATRDELQRTYEEAASAPRTASAVGRLAMLLHAHEQYVSAGACYDRARALDPQAFRWTYLAAIAQAELGEHANAARLLREALAIDPAYLPARLRLADALTRTGDLQGSRAEYETSLHSAPDLALAHHGLGRVAWLLGNSEEAIDRYRRATEAAPQFGPAHYDLALAYRAAGRQSEAAAHLTAFQQWGARRPAPGDRFLEDVRVLNGTARELLAQAARLGKAGSFDESIELHLKALAIDPAAAQAHVNLISLFGRTGRPELAERHYRSAVKLGTSLDEAHYNYGVLLAATERVTDAAAAFQQALDVNPFHAGAHSNLGAVFAREGKLDLAASHYQQAISNNPAHTAARVNLARLLAATGRPEEARERFEQALQRAKALGDTDLAGRIEQELRTLRTVRP